MRGRGWLAAFVLFGLAAVAIFVRPVKPLLPDSTVTLQTGQTEIFTHFFSNSLGEPMPYSVLLPVGYYQHPELRYPVLYLLHGGGDDYRSWLAKSNLIDTVRDYQFIVVMPEGRLDYFINSALPPRKRYEDYIVHDLINEIDHRFRTVAQRNGRAVAGNSMGGFAAVRFGLAHPSLFVFVAGLSSALDVPRRRFSWRRYEQSYRMIRIFGFPGAESRKEADPFNMLSNVTAPTDLPYFYLACGRQDPLFAVNVQFWNGLSDAGVIHARQTTPGGHGWDSWNTALPAFVAAMVSRNDWAKKTQRSVH